MLSDPIVALATPPGRAALAVIRLSGRGAFTVAARALHPFHPDPPRTVRRVHVVHPATGVPLDDALAACFPGPRSYTGEDLVELSTHGGLLVPATAVAALVAAGARPARPGEFTRRAVVNGKLDLLQAEATADLIDAGAPAQARRALQHLDRGLSTRLDELRTELLELEALIAYEIDFPDEDEGPVAPERVVRAWRAARDRIARLLDTAPEGERLREGALLVIAGRPNAGKSSLFNALLGTERAIVTEVPGTTRDAVEAHAVLEGFPFRLVDTAGLRESADRVERLGIEVSRKYLAAADLVLFCRDAGCEMRDPGSQEFLASCRAPVIDVVTKIDLTARPPDRLGVSVVTGEGLADLRRKLAEVAYGRLLALGDVEPVVTRARHRGALERALEEVDAFHTARESGLDAAVAATHLRAAVGALDDLIGVVTPDDVLDRVFASFCVGK
ncbi:MAG: tRNA uridine-5-carboxymethylaminomethyl(34) synthesis GTPase MnmE [Gemmatimonadetes bacterium]|nr:MAG: tRNA uridine-5-carboxymethylaminomethyl(34) synthesis GTPase MnmE [Gemmatimonadota bacterium]PYP06604.1 MAG: tRNA uridine-5-carboxymethylaminomethyl(34) synthesis GTPase MnmE [Gemmatimonadota bacterium]PYP79888.1 MAG: tRNA uridine-5-carboxymethylaminomethyl(34) synthesis GTPase MnmE [Gemmatimonadota bacterium]